MVWIREAQDQARATAEQVAEAKRVSDAKKAAYDAETPPHEGEAEIFLHWNMEPLVPIIQDLATAGYTIDQKTDYLYDSDLPNRSVKPERVDRFSLARNKSTWGGMHDQIEYPQLEVFGTMLTVKRDDRILGSLRLYPMGDDESHMARVDYLTGFGDRSRRPIVVATSTDAPNEITDKLKGVVASWISQDFSASSSAQPAVV